ncbi:MAG TPA: phosphatidylglycerol lysyltransferase domain-containing protein [Bacillota bacterium]|nr:phosphatidylglycerol lysyltransferase domain-containing protein [Bacillota bacterium]
MIKIDTSPRRSLLLLLLSSGIAVHGLLMIGSTLVEQMDARLGRHFVHVNSFALDSSILFGLTLLYLSTLLRRGKRTAWAAALLIYGVIVAVALYRIGDITGAHHPLAVGARTLLLPLLAVAGLWVLRGHFTVRSDLRSFTFSLRFITLVLAVAFTYGTAGFVLLDRHDFHQEITVPDAMHRTIDQFDLTTSHNLRPSTRRARLFLDSLSVVSMGAVGYAVVSLFQPIRARLVDGARQRQLAHSLLDRHKGSSEDFFKLWPHDKLYFFNLSHTAGLAYGVYRGVALVVGDPFGRREAFDSLLTSFTEFCRTNDWLPAFVHTEPKYMELYKKHDFDLQKIGEEAVLQVPHFVAHGRTSKYFRQISNKFKRQACVAELLQPPHNDAVIARLRAISDDWLKQPGRAERRFLMGHFTPSYMQQCPVMVLRDAAGTIQAFINQVPSFDPHEANFDLLRHTHESPGNANDFLLMQFIEYLHMQGYERVNLGLCPLSGLDGADEERSVIDSALRFLYANGDRLYSFSGLRRFKAKYEPEWSGRYIAYRGGIRGFTRVLNALNKAMKV